MYDFIENDFSAMALDFKNRSVIIDPWDIAFNKNIMLEIFENVFKNNYVVSLDNLMAHYFKAEFTKNFGLSEGFDYHISDSGFGSKPYSLITTPRLNSTLKSKLNYVLVFIYIRNYSESELSNWNN